MPWTVRLLEREPPLPPAGVVATGSALEPLRAAARRRIDAGAELRAAAGEGWLLVLGEDLPWADGCVYVGRDGPLLMPTTRVLDQPAELVAAAVASAAELRGPRSRGGEGRGRRPGDVALIVVLEDAILRGPMPVRTAAL